jgi:hypothetical protein
MIKATTAYELAKESAYATGVDILEDLIQAKARVGHFSTTLSFIKDKEENGLVSVGPTFELFYQRPTKLTIEVAKSILSNLGYIVYVQPDRIGREDREELYISWEA